MGRRKRYYNDLAYLFVIVSFFIATPITTLVFLPFFRNLNVFTAYEYLDADLTAVCVGWRPAVHRPCDMLPVRPFMCAALAIIEFTGWDLWKAVALTGAAATLYTAMGE